MTMWPALGLVFVGVGGASLSLAAFGRLAQPGGAGPLDWWPAGVGLGSLLMAAVAWGATRHQVADGAKRIAQLEGTVVTKDDLGLALEPIAEAMDRLAGVESRMGDLVNRAIERLHDTEITRLRDHSDAMANRVARCEAILELRGLTREVR